MTDDRSSWWKQLSENKNEQSIDKDFEAAKNQTQQPEQVVQPEQTTEKHEPFPDRYPAPGGDLSIVRNDILRGNHAKEHAKLFEQTQEKIRQPERKPINLSKDKNNEQEQ